MKPKKKMSMYMGGGKMKEMYMKGGKMPEYMYGGKVYKDCLLYTSPSPRDRQKSRMPSSA